MFCDTYSCDDKTAIVQLYYKNDQSPITVKRQFKKLFPKKPTPSTLFISRLMKKFKATGSVLDKKRQGKPKTVRTPGNIVKVMAAYQISPQKSLSKANSQLKIGRTSIQRILKYDFVVQSYSRK